MRSPKKARESPSFAVPTRERILHAARTQFFAHGFRGVTMDELADSLAMSKKTLYANFPSKTALVEALLIEKFNQVEKAFAQITSSPSTDVLSLLHELLVTVQRHTEEIQPPFLRDILRGAPDLFRLVQHRRQQVIERHFGKLLSAGRKSGIIRKDISANLVIEILLAAVNGIVNPAKLQDLGIAPKTGMSAIMTLFLEGVVTEKGRRQR